MARFTFRLPDIGEGIAEAEIVAWHVKIGDRVEEDQQVADMMTDKATVEMESPVSGVVVELAGEVLDRVVQRRRVRLHRDLVLATDVREPQGGHDRHHRRTRRLVTADLQPVPGRADVIGVMDHPGR